MADTGSYHIDIDGFEAHFASYCSSVQDVQGPSSRPGYRVHAYVCILFPIPKGMRTQNFTPRSHKLHLVVMASLNEVIAVNLQPQSSFLLRSLIELAGMAVYFRFYSYIHTNDCCIVWQQASSTVSNDISHVALRPQLWELHVFWPELCHIWEDILGRVLSPRLHS